MIRSWANAPSRLVYEQQRPRFPSLEIEAALELLAAIDTATSLTQLRALGYAGLRQLDLGGAPGLQGGDRGGRLRGGAGRWAVAAGSGAWICFRFEGGHAYEVDVVERLGIWPQ